VDELVKKLNVEVNKKYVDSGKKKILDLDTINGLLNAEIKWAKTHEKDRFNLTVEQVKWFIKGLEQAKVILTHAEENKEGNK